MARWLWMAGAVVALCLGVGQAALADRVTLVNGDVLHGDVEEAAGRVRIQHAILGAIDLPQADVLWIKREGQPAPEPTFTKVTPPPADACAAPEEKDAAEAKKCPSPWEFGLGFGISNDSGNTEKFQLNTDLEAAYRWGFNRRNHLSWRINSFYEEARGVQTEGKLFSRLAYQRRISPRGQVFGLWLVDRDDFADIEYRSSWFAGYEHDFVKRKRTTFSGAIGGGGVIEKRAGFPRIETAALLAQLMYEHEFSGGDTFQARYYIIPYLDYTERSPMRLELRYAHPINEHLDLTAAFLADYVPDPPGDIEPYDTKFTFGVRWKP